MRMVPRMPQWIKIRIMSKDKLDEPDGVPAVDVDGWYESMTNSFAARGELSTWHAHIKTRFEESIREKGDMMDEFGLTHNAFNLGAVRQALMWENCPLPVPDRYKIGSYFTAADSGKLEEMVLTFEDTDDDIPTFERNKFTVHRGPTLIPTHVALYVNHNPDQRSESKMREFVSFAQRIGIAVDPELAMAAPEGVSVWRGNVCLPWKSTA